MAILQEGSHIVIDASIAGSAFPTSERELPFPVLVDGSAQLVEIGGALYGRALEVRGNVNINGPIVARGDARLSPGEGRIALMAGLTVNGSLNCQLTGRPDHQSILDAIEDAGVIVKGDIAVNQNVVLRNAIVFGSVRATNCTLENCLVLGTCVVDEFLKVSMSSIGGYASRDITFEGRCTMLHALGESRSQPIFVPFEAGDGKIVASDLRYYPAIRPWKSLMNRAQMDSAFPEYSRLFPRSDWVMAQAHSNPALNEESEVSVAKWVLSIGGRICDISQISHAIGCLTQMLKCGFEYEHYPLGQRPARLRTALKDLTDEESWILTSVCA